MLRIFLSLILLLTSTIILHAQEENILINEFGYGGGIAFIELKNLNEEEFDPTDLFVIYNGETFPMSSNNVVCNFPPDNRVIPAIDQQAYYFTEISNEGGELILSKSDAISSADDIIDYVVWGEYAPDHELLAVSNNQWTSGDRAPAFFASGSLEYDGDGITKTDWVIQAVSSSCKENGSNCDYIQGTATFDETAFCSCDDEDEYFSFSLSGNIYENIGGIITDKNNILLDSNFNIENLYQFHDLCFEDSIYLSFLGYDNEIGGLEIGRSIDSLIGCFAITENTLLKGTKIDTFSALLTVSEIEINGSDTIQLCKADSEFVKFSFSHDSSDSIAYYLFEEFGQIIGEYFTNSFELEYSELDAGNYNLVPYAYSGEASNSIGSYRPGVSGCLRPSIKSYVLNVKESSQGSCISSVEEDEKYSDLELKYNAADNKIEIFSPNQDLFIDGLLQIYDVSGKILISKNINSISDASVHIKLLTKGLYIASLISRKHRFSKSFIIH